MTSKSVGVNSVDIGTYTFERSTKNTHVFSRENAAGRLETQYVQKTDLPEGVTPTEITVTISWK